MSGLLPSRRMRWLLLVLACLGAIALFLLATASANTELFAKSIDTLLFVNGVLGALLMAVVGAQLWQLWRKRSSGVFGSRLAVRLVLVFALVAVLPGALVYAASVLFIGRSIESWFDVRVDRALEGGLNLGRNALDYLKQETVNKASQIARHARRRRSRQPVGAVESRGGASGRVTRRRCSRRPAACSRSPASADRRRRRSRRPRRRCAGRACSRRPPRRSRRPRACSSSCGSSSRSTPTTSSSRSRCCRSSSPCRRRSPRISRPCAPGRTIIRRFRLSRQGLKRLYALTLTLTLLLALTSALGLAVVLSERFSAPLGLLAEGTRAVAQGDFTRRQPVTSTRRARRADRIVQHDDGAAARGATEDRGVAPRHGDDARLPREHSRQPVGRRARVRRWLSAAHGQRERGGDPAAAADRADRRARCRTGGASSRRSRRSPSSSRKAFARAATRIGRSRRSSRCPT